MNLFEFFARRRRRTRSRGQSLVEFALILPLLMVFLATILDLGRIYYANISLLNAAREGAFQASKTPDSYQGGQPCNTTTNLIVCRVQLESKGSMVEVDEADIDVDCSKSGCPLEANSTVTVTVDGQFQLITPILGFIFGGQTIDMESSATQQIEYYPTGGVATLPPTPAAAFTASDLTGEAPFAIRSTPPRRVAAPTTTCGTSVTGVRQSRRPSDARLQRAGHLHRHAADHQPRRRRASTMTIDITAPEATPTPTPEGTPTPTPAPSPTPETCAYPPNIIGKNLILAANNLSSAGWTYLISSDLYTGTKNKIQAQSPDHNLCSMKSTTTILAHYRPGVECRNEDPSPSHPPAVGPQPWSVARRVLAGDHSVRVHHDGHLRPRSGHLHDERDRQAAREIARVASVHSGCLPKSPETCDMGASSQISNVVATQRRLLPGMAINTSHRHRLRDDRRRPHRRRTRPAGGAPTAFGFWSGRASRRSRRS